MTRLLLLCILLVGARTASAEAGIFSSAIFLTVGGTSVQLAGDQTADGLPALRSYFIAPVTAGSGLTLTGARVKSFKNNNTDVTGAFIAYRVTPANMAPTGNFTTISLTFQENLNGGGDQRWETAGLTNSLSAACGVGNVCTLEVFWRH